ncbi:MAG: hypothetical protein JJT78_08995 [Leptospira sp.]|nr:hypothetical protein [Leptospira sp.]
MKHLLTVSVLNTILQPNEEGARLVKILESFLHKNEKFYATALSIFEVLQEKPWESGTDQKDFLNQSGILCEEIFPVTKDDLTLYSQLCTEYKAGLETIELAVAVNRGMESLLVWKVDPMQSKWLSIRDLSLES